MCENANVESGSLGRSPRNLNTREAQGLKARAIDGAGFHPSRLGWRYEPRPSTLIGIKRPFAAGESI
jgi:hypothetical protein